VKGILLAKTEEKVKTLPGMLVRMEKAKPARAKKAKLAIDITMAAS
jgi:hypothetical protein